MLWPVGGMLFIHCQNTGMTYIYDNLIEVLSAKISAVAYDLAPESECDQAVLVLVIILLVVLS